MTDTSRPRVPLGLPSGVAAVGLGAVIATGGQGWQLAVSVVLALVLVAADLTRLRGRART